MGKGLLFPLRKLHGYVHEKRLQRQKAIATYRHCIQTFYEKRRANKKCVFLVMTPAHGNIGDQAIAYAEICMLEKLGIDYIEISEYQLRDLKKAHRLDMMNGYPILVQGGGYFGTIWFGAEMLLRDVIVANPQSKILLFPNTIYYEDSDWGRQELSKSVEIYNRHEQLYLYAREAVSFEAMTKLYHHVKLIPDVVLSLEARTGVTERKGCLLCLRGDCEKTRTETDDAIILDQVKKLFNSNYAYTDMCADYRISPQMRTEEVIKKIDEFSCAQLVITDRLHGMIFCAISQTPCIVIDSKSPKVKGCYEWIEHLQYIQFAESVDEIVQVYQKMQKKSCVFDNSSLQPYYDTLVSDIDRICEKR